MVYLDAASSFCSEMGNGESRASEAVLSASEKNYAAHPVSSNSPVIRQVILHCGEKLDDVIYLVRKGWTLRFILGPSLCDMNVRLFMNCQSVGIDEEQGQYELIWHKQHFGSFGENVQIFADVHATVTGSFHYFFTIDGTGQQESASGSGYFIVQPLLRVGRSKINVPLRGIVCQTLLSKNLGPFSGWLECLIVAKKTGYNAIHFTPLQVCDFFIILLAALNSKTGSINVL